MTGVPEPDQHPALLQAALLVSAKGMREGFGGGEQVEEEEGGGGSCHREQQSRLVTRRGVGGGGGGRGGGRTRMMWRTGGDVSIASPPILACQLDTRALQTEGARGRRVDFPKNLLPMIAGGGMMW